MFLEFQDPFDNLKQFVLPAFITGMGASAGLMTEIKIEPVDKNTAEEIQTMLERKIGVQVVEDDVKADKEEKKEEILQK